MSQTKKVKVTCSKCGAENEALIWDSINTGINPEQKQNVINGSLFINTCPECGEKDRHNYTTLYHDMQNKVMIYYACCEEDFNIVKNNLKQLESDFADSLKGYRIRLVVSQNALMEKALIFEKGLDDRAIEVIKAVFAIDAMEKFPELEIDELLFYITEKGKHEIQFLANRPLTGEIDDKLYRTIRGEFGAKLDALSDTYIIDMNWAFKFLK